MFSFLLSLIAGLLERAGLHWLANHKIDGAKDAVNKDASLSSDDVQRKLREWERD